MCYQSSACLLNSGWCKKVMANALVSDEVELKDVLIRLLVRIEVILEQCCLICFSKFRHLHSNRCRNFESLW